MKNSLAQTFSSLYAQSHAVGLTGQKFELINGISADEVELINDIILEDHSVRQTLEVGCAIGFSSLAITTALRDRSGALHTIIDPFQTSQWDSCGISLLERNDIHNFRLLETRSEFALPAMVSEGSVYDFILLDGWHTFDHTLIDMFYSLRLLRVGGYLAVDDTNWPSVAKVVSYYNNVPALILHSVTKPTRKLHVLRPALNKAFENDAVRKLIIRASPTRILQEINSIRYGSMVLMKKIADDNRNFDWYAPF
jgi:predicted O-methyltransferase YrrM